MTHSITKETISHKQIAAMCFNKVWDYLEKKVLTEEEAEKMIHLCHSSFWHWSQAKECTTTNLSIGYWQLSRVYSVVNEGENAWKYAEKSLKVSVEETLAPFYTAYAFEAKTRALLLLKRNEEARAALEEGLKYTDLISDEKSKELVLVDLQELKDKL